MAYFKGIRTTKPGRSRLVKRARTKSKVIEPRSGKDGPYPKTRYSRQWKIDGVAQITAKNPRFT